LAALANSAQRIECAITIRAINEFSPVIANRCTLINILISRIVNDIEMSVKRCFTDDFVRSPRKAGEAFAYLSEEILRATSNKLKKKKRG